MIPIWLYAGYWLKNNLKDRQIPYLALAAAFSFVIMMFNVPIVGGSTGHAVGSALIAIILGPWVAVVTVSVALIMQALLFGDGGITAIGANCFNMAFVMPFLAYYVYKFISGKTEITSNTRTLAAGVGGYVALAAGAFFTALELGIQPALHTGADGVPLYMPYGLDVTIPAMMIEHLVLFCFVEAIITALAFAYIARYDPTIIFDYKGGQDKIRSAAPPAPA